MRLLDEVCMQWVNYNKLANQVTLETFKTFWIVDMGKTSSILLYVVCLTATQPFSAFVSSFVTVCRSGRVQTFGYLAMTQSQDSSTRRRRQATSTMRRRPGERRTSQGKEESDPGKFDAKTLTSSQNANEEAPAFELMQNSESQRIPMDEYFEFISLQELFPGPFADLFDQSQHFREDLRKAIRTDIFYSNPSYVKLLEKPAAVAMMLSNETSVEGTWKSKGHMTRLTQVLEQYLGDNALSGDDLMYTIGALCGPRELCSGHWIDIVGRKDRVLNHSWHQDTGCNASIYTVLWGFPSENFYSGTGVYSHMIKLCFPHVAPDNHPPNVPILFPDLFKIDDEYIVKPKYCKGRELLRFKDTNSLHSAPDVTYRSSLMRFM